MTTLPILVMALASIAFVLIGVLNNGGSDDEY